MGEFKTKSIFQRMRMPVEELKVYYRDLRRYRFEQKKPIKGIWWRKRTYGLLVKLVQIDRILGHEKNVVLENKHTPTKRPIIFAATHAGGFDIARICEVIKGDPYIFMGDPGEIYKSVYGLLAFLVGWVPFDTGNKLERKIATLRAEELLRRGGNLLIFPEGAWNFSDHLPVMRIYNGAARMALHTKAVIVPIAIEVYGKTWYISIGQNIDAASLGMTDENTLTEYIRDQLATLKWEIWEQAPKAKQVTGMKKAEWEDRIRGLCVMGDDFSTEPALLTIETVGVVLLWIYAAIIDLIEADSLILWIFTDLVLGPIVTIPLCAFPALVCAILVTIVKMIIHAFKDET